MFAKVTKGALSGKAGEPAKADFEISGQYVNTSEKGVIGILSRRIYRKGRPRLFRFSWAFAAAILHEH